VEVVKNMRRFHKFCSLTLITFFLTLTALAQTAGLPRFKKNENYKTARIKMLKAGWKPYHSPDADECFEGDERCQGRPEMETCAGTGLAPCSFVWKRKGKTAVITTVGENTILTGSRIL
jgi:hypothetical protein